LSGRHVSTLQGHHQALQEDRSKSCIMFHCIVGFHLGSHNAVKLNTSGWKISNICTTINLTGYAPLRIENCGTVKITKQSDLLAISLTIF